jgi:GNAT superfamily N-acetyltransferase
VGESGSGLRVRYLAEGASLVGAAELVADDCDPLSMGRAAAHERALAWRAAELAQLCDLEQPWEYGTIWRASRYPKYWAYNLVRVERPPALSAPELVALADDALAGLEHRCIDFDPEPGALRGELEALGWRSVRLVLMRHEHDPELAGEHRVEEVHYDAVRDLRIAWHAEDFPGHELGDHIEESAQVARRREARVFAVLDGDRPLGYSTLERIGNQAEIAAAYVVPDRRGKGIGTALTLAAIAAGRDRDDLFICADDEDRPKHLYERLGFRPAWTMTKFLRLPDETKSPELGRSP